MGDLLDVTVDEVGQSLEIRGALVDRERGPGRKGRLGGGHREVRLHRTGARHVGQLPGPVERRAVLERSRGRDALTVDVVIG